MPGHAGTGGRDVIFAWEQCKLGDVGTFKGGFGFPENEQGNDSGIPFYKVSDMNDRYNALMMKRASNYVSDSQIDINNWKPILGQNIIFAKVGSAVYLERKRKVVGPFLLDNNMMSFQPKNADIDYIYYIFQRLHISKHAQVGTLPSLNAGELRNIEINIPSLAEQRVVANIGVKIDQTITLHEEKKRQLERLKSALLQKMFADKSGYPAVRFKGFDDIWDQEKLNSLVRLHRGLTYSPNNVQDSGIRILRSSNILDGQFVMTDDDIFVKSSVVNIPTVKDGDILITAANGSIKLVGKHAIISGISENTAVSGGFMLVGSSRIPDFVNSLFDTSWYQRFIRKYVTGGNGSIGNLKKNDLDKQYVKVPTTSEQERIGEFFREIDQLIINNQIKHEKLLELKKFLLQNMFI
ncbi:restriction endonuclease subunit S [Lactobacillus delbrueckii]|uniref:restriction endonuclease subunit S n=1 Tax=Lactobacillus delbrueckii TaxID=1584 RepID=UPI00288A0191|nr:restriction endonuclease subunit S [Lactobacillus delbrueckii]